MHFSASDLSEQIIYDSWGKQQSNPNVYASLIQHVVKAFDWLQKKSIEISRIGSICNILNYTNGAHLKEEFCVRVIYCLGYALEPIHQNEFATKVLLHSMILVKLKFLFSFFHIFCILFNVILYRFLNGLTFTFQVQKNPNIVVLISIAKRLNCTNRMI